MKDLGEVEAGEMDPLRYNVIEHRQTELVKHWCVACLESKEEGWKVQRKMWWGALDDALKL